MQQYLSSAPFAASLWADAVRNRSQQPLPAVRGLHQELLRLQAPVAYQADLHDPDPHWSSPRKLFAAALPGFVLGFFTLVASTDLTTLQIYERLVLYFVASIGSFFALDALLPLSVAMLTALYAVRGHQYFLLVRRRNVDRLVEDGHRDRRTVGPLADKVCRLGAGPVLAGWTRVVELQFEQESAPVPQPVQLSVKGSRALRAEKERVDKEKGAGPSGDDVEVKFEPEGRVVGAEVGLSLLEVAERNGQAIEAGCRMGVCGADPIAVLDGAGCLSAPEEEELNTLRRLGFARNTRMACCARVQAGARGNGPQAPAGRTKRGSTKGVRPLNCERGGDRQRYCWVTAADFTRRGHPDCEIHLVGAESHVLYNRMGILRLVYGRSAMQGLFLLAEQWYDEHNITAWLNTVATRIDLGAQQVFLGTGEVLFYDRLVLAMGSSSTVPPVEGFGCPGSFVMREAGDAIAIRAYVQRNGCRQAVVSGGGLLGLEAAYSLYELGLEVTVLERGPRLLSRQIDQRCSELVHRYFEGIGMQVLYGAETVALRANSALQSVALKDGRELPCQLFLGAIGIRPNIGLAKEAGISVNRGVMVDDRMETSVPGVFAAGDVAEHSGLVLGLWPIAAKQGEVAAVNALGGDERLQSDVPACILKGAGIELSSIGQVEPGPDDELVVIDNPSRRVLPAHGDLRQEAGRRFGARPSSRGFLRHIGRGQEGDLYGRCVAGRPPGRGFVSAQRGQPRQVG